METRSRILRLAGLTLAGLVAVVLAATAVSFGLLQTRWAKDKVADLIAAALQTEAGTVEIGELDGSLPYRLRLQGVSVSDEEGIWLRIEEAELDWNPLSLLLRNHVDADRLHIKRPHLLRGPIVSKPEEDGGSVLPSLPEFGISIESLLIDDLELDPEVAGTEAHFDASGRLESSQGGELQLHLELQRHTRQDPTVMADMIYNRQAGTLSVDLRAQELMGGPWAHLLGWKDAPPWRLSLQGTGPLSGWKGRLEGVAMDTVRIGLDIHAEGPDVLQIMLSGTVDLDREFEGTTSEFFAPPFELDVVLALSETNQVNISGGKISNAAGGVEISGGLDLTQETVDAVIAYRPSDSQRVMSLIEPLTLRSLTLNGRLSGQLAAPTVSLTAEISGLGIGSVRSEETHATFTAEGIRLGQVFPVSVEAALDGMSLIRPQENAPSLPSVQLAARGLIDLEAGFIDIDQAEISSSMAMLRVSGRVPTGPDDLASLQMSLDGELRAAPFEDPVLSSLLKDPLKIHALLGVPTTRDRYELTELLLDHPLIRVTGRASLRTPMSEGLGSVNFLVEDLDLLARRFDLPIRGGSLSISSKLEGGISEPRCATRLTADDVKVKEIQLGPLDVSLVLSGADQGVWGQLHAKFGGLPEPTSLIADMTVAGERGPLDIQSLEFSGAGAQLSGYLRLASFDAPIEGEVSGSVPELAPWAALFDMPLGGSASLSATFTSEQSRQHIRAQTVIQDLRSTVPGSESLGAESTIISMWSSDEAEGAYSYDLQGEGVSLGTARFEQFSLTGATDFTVSDFSLEAAGNFRGDLAVSAAGRLEVTPPALTLELNRLSGQALESAFALSEPASLVQTADRLSLKRLAMIIGDGDVSISGHYGKGSLEATAQLRHAPLGSFSLFFPQAAFTGNLSGEVQIAASQTGHMGEVGLDIEALTAIGHPELAPLGGRVSGQWAEGRVQIEVDLDDKAQSHLRAKGEAPLAYDVVNGAFSVPSAGSVAGELSWRGEIGPVWDAFGSDSHQLRGTINAQARLSGTAGEPHASGSARVTGGSYLNLDFGTVLKEVEATFEGSEDEIVLSRATATDGGKGSVSAHGRIRLDPARKFPAEFELTAENATLARAEAVTVKGGGKLNYTRERGVALLKGGLETSEIEALLIDVLSAEIVDLDVLEVGGTEAAAEAKPAESIEYAGGTDLDVTATVPGRAFIRGRGLDSEWRGQAELTGTSFEPILTGSFELVRGRFDFAGRGFRLTRGTVEFRGGSEIDPWIDLESEYRDQDFKALAQVSGPVSSPKITLSSDPELPKDEVMSRILFGTSVSELGPVEALQLADAIRTLSNPGKSGGILGKARGTLGLDVFRVGGNGNGVEGTTVTGGKYLTDNIYVEVERGLTGEEDKISVEVQLTPRISVESELMQDADSNIGIKWRKDY